MSSFIGRQARPRRCAGTNAPAGASTARPECRALENPKGNVQTVAGFAQALLRLCSGFAQALLWLWFAAFAIEIGVGLLYFVWVLI